MLGKYRMDAIWRVLGLVYFVTIGAVVLTIGLIAGLVWMVADVVTQLLLNRQGLPQPNNPVGAFLGRLYNWPLDQLNYVVLGEGSFPFLP